MDNNKKQLVISILKFLKTEVSSKDVDEEMAESLEVAAQCLETAYGIENNDNDLDIIEIFNEALQKRLPPSSKPNITEPVIDNKKADALKNEGNNLMKAEKYIEAISCYTQAINYDPKNAVYYCNRAAAYTKLEENQKAIDDCERAISNDPTYSKAYGRLGLVYLNVKDFGKAEQCYEKAVALEPANESYKKNLELARENLKPQNPQNPLNPAPGANPLAGMDLGALLNNPAVMNMAISQIFHKYFITPEAQSFMQNPQMQSMFSNLMGGAPPPPSGRVGDASSETFDTSTTADTNATPGEATAGGFGGGPGGFQLPAGLDFGNIMNATQQFAEQMRHEDPELVDNLRQQFQQGPQPPMDGSEPPPKDDSEKPDGSS